jgi:hypothetical protein
VDTQTVTLVTAIAFPLWATLVMIALPCFTVLTTIAAAWYIIRTTNAQHAETAKILNDITARTQVIIAQNRDVLRRLEP